MTATDKIDRNDPVPLYLQLARLWRHQIAAGWLKAGDQLAPEPEICRQYEVSAITVKQAMKELVNEGLLSRERGRGTFVTRQKLPPQDLTRLSDLAEAMEASGVEVMIDVVRREKVLAHEDQAELLDINFGDPLIHLDRVFRDSHEVLAVEQVDIPTALCPDLLDADLTNRSLYAILEELYGLRPVKADQFIEAIVAEGTDARLLCLPEGSPVVQAERITSLSDGRVVAYSRLLYRGDRYKFRVTQTRNRT